MKGRKPPPLPPNPYLMGMTLIQYQVHDTTGCDAVRCMSQLIGGFAVAMENEVPTY